jgi:hypothetical protein
MLATHLRYRRQPKHLKLLPQQRKPSLLSFPKSIKPPRPMPTWLRTEGSSGRRVKRLRPVRPSLPNPCPPRSWLPLRPAGQSQQKISWSPHKPPLRSQHLLPRRTPQYPIFPVQKNHSSPPPRSGELMNRHRGCRLLLENPSASQFPLSCHPNRVQDR